MRSRLDQLYPRLPYAAALHGPGREMLGLETQLPRSPTTSGGGAVRAPQEGQLAGCHRGGDERTHVLGRSSQDGQRQLFTQP